MTPTALLQMSGIRKTFGATCVLDDVSFSLMPGECMALIGENGAGKSTLMKILSGALQPDAGSMVLEGAAYAPATPMQGRLSGVAMIYQELTIAPHLSVAENIMLGVEPCLGPFLRRAELRSRAEAALRQIHPDLPLDEVAGRLGPGERQLVEIARLLASGCRVVVMDEPTSSLSGPDVKRLFGVIRHLRERGLGIVYISHFLEEVMDLCDAYTVLRDGRSVATGRMAETSVGELASLMVGREVRELYPRTPRRTGDVLLRAADVSGVHKPKGVNIEVRRGEVLGLAGLVGAGRTETLRVLFGLDRLSGGKVQIGTAVGDASPRMRWAGGTGFLSEDRKGEGLATALSVAGNMAMPVLRRYSRGGLVSGSALSEDARRVGERVRLKCASMDQPVGSLSGGNQQKTAFARLLLADVDVLLLDEPTRGIDIASKAEIYRLIDELARGAESCGGRARAIIMVSSYLPELLGVCDRIGVMCRGRLVEVRPAQEWTEHGIMLAATGVGQSGEAV